MIETMRQGRLFPNSCYCIDANALINLMKYPGYPRDIFPMLWEKLESMVERGRLISHVEVYKEIEKQRDEIYSWCKQNRKIFKDVDECQIQMLNQIERKYNPEYWKTEMNKDSPWADPWLIALSICEDTVIVTDEKDTADHIPYVANAFQRQVLNLLDFFRAIEVNSR